MVPFPYPNRFLRFDSGELELYLVFRGNIPEVLRAEGEFLMHFDIVRIRNVEGSPYFFECVPKFVQFIVPDKDRLLLLDN